MKLKDMTIKQLREYCESRGCDDCTLLEFCGDEMTYSPRDIDPYYLNLEVKNDERNQI